MPQPLPRDARINFSFKPDEVLKRPTLAPYIAAISMNWNEIEAHIGVFLAALLGGEAQTVMKVFFALQTDGGRKATIDTVTKLKLNDDDLTLFQEIMGDVGRRYSERNKAIHGAWGVGEDYPNGLLWYDPRESTRAFADIMADAPAERAALFKELNKSIRIYTERDFKDILERFECTYKKLRKFTGPFVDSHFDRLGRTGER